jgi:hypothetical protein
MLAIGANANNGGFSGKMRAFANDPKRTSLSPSKGPICAATMPFRSLGMSLKRYELITHFSGAAVWPLATRAQQPTKPVIRFFDLTMPPTLIGRDDEVIV